MLTKTYYFGVQRRRLMCEFKPFPLKNMSKCHLAYKTNTSNLISKTKMYINTFDVTESEFEIFYLLARVVLLNNRSKEFQFKILHRYLATNGLLFKMKIIKDKFCTFCKEKKKQ